MADPVVSYPFDPTGQAASNKITGEQIIVHPPGDRLFHYSLPEFAPFFAEGLVLKLRNLDGSVIPLVKGVDYYLGHKFMDASLATMHPIYGSFSWLRTDIVGTVIADYQTLGDIWTVSSSKIAEILMNTIKNPRITSWESVVERPVDFPVIDHLWNLDDMVGQKEILEVVENFYQAFLTSLDPEGGGTGTGIVMNHINARDNPHQVSAAQTGAYTTLQTDTKLSLYVLKTEQATDSQKFGGKTYAQVMAEVATVKVNSATAADTATNATNATTAANSTRLGNKNLSEVLQDAAAQTAANATKFDNKSYSQAAADILAGTAANASKLEGKSLAEIIAQLQQASGDATSLNGKNLTQIMVDVKATKVDSATAADTAGNATQLGGQSLSQVLATVAETVPDNSHNAEKVYGYTFEELITSIVQSQTYSDSFSYRAIEYIVEGRTLVGGTGGTQDPLYGYTILGEFEIPLTGAGNDKFDTAARRYSTAMDVFLFFAGKSIRLNVVATIKDDQSMVLEYFSNQALGVSIQLGVRSVNSTITSVDGSVIAKFNQVYMKFLKTDSLRKYSVFQFDMNAFELNSQDDPSFWDHTYGALNSVVWQPVSVPTQIAAMQSSFDDLAEDLETLLATPAA